MYFANPTSETAVHDAMNDGAIGFIDTPRQGNPRPAGVAWCADNGCFGKGFYEQSWWSWLQANATSADTCAFATAPDVVADAAAFEAAHHLPNVPEGHKCRRLHGHSYRVVITVREHVGSDGMVMDFADVDAVAKPVIDALDHRCLNDFYPNPTSELIAVGLWEQLADSLPLSVVTVSETDRSSAIFRGQLAL